MIGSLGSKLKFNNGIEIPAFGLGVYKSCQRCNQEWISSD